MKSGLRCLWFGVVVCTGGCGVSNAVSVADAERPIEAPPPAGNAGGLSADPARSRLTFTGEQAGEPFEGRFAHFTALVLMDEADLARSRIRAVIELESADTQDEERDGYLRGPDLFATDQWPRSVFASRSIARADDGSYLADAVLTLRDKTRPVTLAFEFLPPNDTRPARLTGRATLKRLDFGVGQGEWRATDWVGDEIVVEVDLELR